MLKALFTILIFCPIILLSQNLTSNTNINITKSWPQQPNGYTYPLNIFVPPGPAPQGGFPVCILLHGNGGNGPGMINQFIGTLQCHILVAPTAYENSWNICAEESDAPDIEMINDLANNLQGYDNVNQNKIRILGSSNGSGLANRVFIENNNPGIDIICAIVSHLNEAQYHSSNFYQPGELTNPDSSFCGYNSVTTPLTTRKYLSISNDNDNLIPYTGGPSDVGVSFLPAETAAYTIAKHNGYTGSILTSGITMGNPTITEFSYLSGNVVLIKGNAMHSINNSQKEYIKEYFSDCALALQIDENTLSGIKIYPNPTGSSINIKLDIALLGCSYSLYDSMGRELFTEKITSENVLIELTNLSQGIYFIKLKNKAFKVVKQ
jgi:poly(3-hydroxybutyrate) depolymerase